MNLTRINEEIMQVIEEQFDDELDENKRKHRMYQRACEALVEVMNELEANISPATGFFDEDTNYFYQLLSEACTELNSRSLAYQE